MAVEGAGRGAMDSFAEERRGLFDGLKVPFDLHMLLLGLVAVAIFRGGIAGIEWLTNQPYILPRLTHPIEGWSVYTDPIVRACHHLLGTAADPNRIIAAVGGDPTHAFSLPPVVYILVFVWALGLWAFFSAAINRIAAMKIAREEGLELKEALGFAREKFISNAASVIFVLVLIATFYCFFNATVAGWIGWIPWVGDVLLGVLYFLVLLSTFFIVSTVILGLFGFNMVSSAIATESSDVVDGISRSWNYILFRPWQVLLYFGLTVAYLVCFLAFSTLFLDWSVSSLSLGWWGIGTGHAVVEVANEQGVVVERVSIPEKGAYIAGVVDGEYTLKHVFYRADPTGDETFTNAAAPIDVAPHIPLYYKISAYAVKAWLLLMRYLVLGYIVYYIFASNTLMYFLLRKDVEGEDYSEIVIEEELWEEDEFGDVPAPAPAAAAKSAAPAPMEAPKGDAPAAEAPKPAGGEPPK